MLERYAWGHGSETRDQAEGSPGKCSGEVGFSSVEPGPEAQGGWPKGDGPRPMGRILCAMASSGPRFACAIMCYHVCATMYLRHKAPGFDGHLVSRGC